MHAYCRGFCLYTIQLLMQRQQDAGWNKCNVCVHTCAGGRLGMREEAVAGSTLVG